MSRVNIMGIGFDNVTLPEALDRTTDILRRGGRGYVVTPNSEIVYASRENPQLGEIINHAALVIPDGIGVIYAARILRNPLKERVPGIELGEALVNWASRNRRSVYFLGGKPGIAERAAENLRKSYPGFILAGTHDGYFTDDREVVEEISDICPDIIIVCMGSPRQEQFMAAHMEEFPPCVMLALGGSIDIYAGEIRRAPRFFLRFGLEWLYRLLQQPSRIGRMIKIPVFLWLAVCQRFGWGEKGDTP